MGANKAIAAAGLAFLGALVGWGLDTWHVTPPAVVVAAGQGFLSALVVYLVPHGSSS